MSDIVPQVVATDKELFDLLIAPKQRITERVMLRLASDRRIFCSHLATREEMADYLSSLTHDLDDVEGLIEQGGSGTRAEKTTFVTIGAKVSAEDIKRALDLYSQEVGSAERVTVPPFGKAAISANLEYSEFDYSRTRLLQRQKKSAALEFSVEDEGVTIRLPSTDKSMEVVERIIDIIEKERKERIPQEKIIVSDLTTEMRSRFFIYLIAKMDGYRTETVTRLKVSSETSISEEVDEDEDEAEEVARDIIHLVDSVALSGENLLASPQYSQLVESGFFITSMTWRATQVEPPYDRVQFDVSFEDARAGTGFRYMVRISQLSTRERYAQSFKAPSEVKKRELFNLIEATARAALRDMRSELGDDGAAAK